MKLINDIPLLVEWHSPMPVDNLRDRRGKLRSRRYARAGTSNLGAALCGLALLAGVLWMVFERIS